MRKNNLRMGNRENPALLSYAGHYLNKEKAFCLSCQLMRNKKYRRLQIGHKGMLHCREANLELRVLTSILL